MPLPGRPREELVAAAEKCVASMGDALLVTDFLERAHTLLPAESRIIIEAILQAFAERGESSDDVAEEAGLPTPWPEDTDPASTLVALLAYAARSAGLLELAVAGLLEREPTRSHLLPTRLYECIEAALMEAK
ncbi:MAG: hypothetical protein ACYDA5_07070 [Vulcanimicrobiaceae bacterium]